MKPNTKTGAKGITLNGLSVAVFVTLLLILIIYTAFKTWKMNADEKLPTENKEAVLEQLDAKSQKVPGERDGQDATEPPQQ